MEWILLLKIAASAFIIFFLWKPIKQAWNTKDWQEKDMKPEHFKMAVFVLIVFFIFYGVFWLMMEFLVPPPDVYR